jgi:hypothetical protein
MKKSTKISPRKTKSNRTQWTAQFLVAAELVRRGYVVAFTMGNHSPVADLMVGVKDGGNQFWVDVKGSSASAAWLVKKKASAADLFYVLVLVGQSREQDRFFILTQGEANRLADEYRMGHPRQKTTNPDGFNWGDALPFEGRWERLPPPHDREIES